MTTDPVSSPVQGEAVEPVADTEAVETVRRVPEESYTITTECRANRGDGGAWDEAAARLRVVYNAQLARFGPAAVYRLEFHREPAPGVPRYVYDAARDSRPVALPTAREAETRTVEYSIVRDYDGYRYGGYNEDCRAPGCDCYLARLPEPIIGDEHVEQREVYRTPWRRVGASS